VIYSRHWANVLKWPKTDIGNIRRIRTKAVAATPAAAIASARGHERRQHGVSIDIFPANTEVGRRASHRTLVAGKISLIKLEKSLRFEVVVDGSFYLVA